MFNTNLTKAPRVLSGASVHHAVGKWRSFATAMPGEAPNATTVDPLGRRWVSHKVTNQSVPLSDYNLYDTDICLKEAVKRQVCEMIIC